MVINQEKMRELYGVRDADFTDRKVIELIKARVDWLATHNKNYNTWQWAYIQDIQDMLDAIEF